MQLPLDEFIVISPFFNQWFVIPALNYFSLPHYIQFIAFDNRRQSMRHRQNSYIMVRSQLFDWLLHHLFTVGIQRRCRFVKNKYLWLSHQTSGNSNSLPLASAYIVSFLPNNCIISFRKSFFIVDELCAARFDSSCFQIFKAVLIIKTISYVLFNGAWENCGFLIDETNLFPEMFNV